MTNTRNTTVPRFARRLALVLCCATFPLLFVGGLVTTSNAGMAVPDWPNTYGYNLLLYPLSTWLAGPWDLFVEHGHRLLGAAVGMISLCLFVYVNWINKAPQKWLRWLSFAILMAIVFQGVLGGARVLVDARTLALIHGCTGPLVFLLAVIFAECCSEKWLTASLPISDKNSSVKTTKLRILTTLTAATTFIQLVLGAHLRHATEWLSPTAFRMITIFHLVIASLLVVEIGYLFFVIRSGGFANRFIALSWLLVGIICSQIAMGIATWMLKYGWPWGTEALVNWVPRSWLPENVEDRVYIIPARSFLQTIIVTSHVAIGSLILAITGLMSFRSWSVFAELPAVSKGASEQQPVIATNIKSNTNTLATAFAYSLGGVR